MAEMTLRQLADNLKAFNPDKEAEKVILDNGEFAVKLNQNQMVDGEDSKDNENTPSYFGASYAKFKNRLNPRAGLGTPDLRLTGKFHAMMKFFKKGKNYLITSKDDKTGELVNKYGKDIFGLNKSNTKTFRNKNDSDFIQVYKAKTGL
jgi:hypothetical protein